MRDHGTTVRPFNGLRFSGVPIAEVVSPPYDVINEHQRTALAGKHPFNMVHIDLPAGGETKYLDAARLFRGWVDDGVLRYDRHCVYGYEVRDDETAVTHRGVIAERSLSPLTLDRLRPHERTTSRAVRDRDALLEASEADLSPIWLLTEADIADLLPSPPITAVVVHENHVRHCLWPISGDPAKGLCAALEEGVHVVADGHHRLQVALEHSSVRHKSRSGVMAFFTPLSATVRSISPIYRLVDVAGLEDRVIMSVLSILGARETDRPPTVGAFAAGFRTRWFVLSSDDTEVVDTVAIDVAIAELANGRVTYTHDRSEMLAAAAHQLVFIPRAPTPAQLLATVSRHELLPPKSTLFTPKPLTGMVLRDHLT